MGPKARTQSKASASSSAGKGRSSLPTSSRVSKRTQPKKSAASSAKNGARGSGMPTTPKGSVAPKYKKTPIQVPTKSAKDYVLPPTVPEGTILQDILKKQWRVGKPVGQGGFGRIYLVSSEIKKPVDGKTCSYVMKMEPHDNGPLFCEQRIYQLCMKEDQLRDWCKKNKLDYIGVPTFGAVGHHFIGTERFRFLVIQKMDRDLAGVLKQNGEKFPRLMCAKLAVRMIDALEFVHSKKYAHADIKESNMMLLGNSKVYLVDFGLASKYTFNDVLRPYEADPRRKHDGTREYTSLDAHNGALPSRRGDFEILGFCLVRWLAGTLPWIKCENLDEIARQKEKYMKNIGDFLKVLKISQYPEVRQYLEYVAGLKYQEEPDYAALRKMFLKVIADSGSKLSSPFVLQERKSSSSASAGTTGMASRVPKAVANRPKAPAKSKPSSGSTTSTAGSSSTTPCFKTPTSANITPRRRPLALKNPATMEVSSKMENGRKAAKKHKAVEEVNGAPGLGKTSSNAKHPRLAKKKVVSYSEDTEDSDEEGKSPRTSGRLQQQHGRGGSSSRRPVRVEQDDDDEDEVVSEDDLFGGGEDDQDSDDDDGDLYRTCVDQTMMLSALNDSSSELDLDSSMTGWTDAMKAQLTRKRERQISTSKGSARGSRR